MALMETRGPMQTSNGPDFPIFARRPVRTRIFSASCSSDWMANARLFGLSVGAVKNGDQPSPHLAARCTALSLPPPTHKVGCGFVTGLDPLPETLKFRPCLTTGPPLQARLIV